MDKLVKFYRMDPIPSLQFNGAYGDLEKRTYDIFNCVFENRKTYSHCYDKKDYIIEVQSFSNESMFAICSTPRCSFK